MTRITKKKNGDVIVPTYRTVLPDGKEEFGIATIELLHAYNKLSSLEDLEAELCCPIEVIFKAKKQKHIFVDKAYCCGAGEVYDLTLRKNPTKAFCDLSLEFTQVDEVDDYFKEFANKWCFQFQYNIDNDDVSWDYYLVRLSDYKITWWLKEDRSE